MTLSKLTKYFGAGAAAAAVVLAGAFVASLHADDGNDDNIDAARVQRGLAIAPVRLQYNGRNRSLVGLGSYLVNAAGGCNDCHTNPPYSAGGDPFQGQPKKINAAGYLGGGVAFGPFVSRNLTPDTSGRPAGGATLGEFRSILRTGIDPDRAHPQFGPFLQVMPWPLYQDLTDQDILAIYTYLGAIPCVEGDPGLPHPRPANTRCR